MESKADQAALEAWATELLRADPNDVLGQSLMEYATTWKADLQAFEEFDDKEIKTLLALFDSPVK